MNMLARICALVLGLLLSACGGGGGDTGTPALGGSTQALFTSAPASVSVDVGRAAEFTIAGGKAPYAVSSSDLSIVSTGLQGTATFLVNGVKGGTATVTVKDSLGAAVSIAVTVGPGTALFTTASSQVTVAVGAAESFTIGGGSGPFSVSSANSTTATIQLNTSGSSFTVTGQRSGTTSVVVTDVKGATVTIGVTVGSGQGSVALFTSAASPVVIGVGTTPVYTIGGGTGPYQVTSSNESVAKATVVGNSVAISGLAAGAASVQVTDAVGGRVSIAVTVGAADVVALYTTAPPGLSLVRGTSQSFVIGGGVGPYTASSGNAAVVSATVTGSSLALAGLGVGTSTVAVFDSQGRSTPIAVTVGASAPLSTTAPASLTLAPGTTGSYQVAGGVSPYQVVSSNSSVGSITQNGSTFSLAASAPGVTQVTVRDSAGGQLQIALTVAATQPLFISAPQAVSMAVGTSASYTVGAGAGGYTVSSSNTSVVTASLSGTTLTLNALSTGTATVVVRDAAGATQSVTVTAGPAVALFATAPAAITVAPTSTQSYSVGGGVAPYSATSSNTAVATATVSGGVLTVSGVASGSATVSLRDAAGTLVSVGVTVSSTASQVLAVTPTSASGTVGETLSFAIRGGDAPYTVAANNSAVASISSSGNAFSANLVKAGQTTISVIDAKGQIQPVTLTVVPAPGTPLFVSSAPAVTLAVGTGQSYDVGGGTPGYTVSSSNTSVVTASLSGTTLTLNALSTGTATVVVRDAAGATQSVTVTAGPALALFTTAPSAITVAPLSTQSYSVGGGVAPYSATSSNTAVATATVSGGVLTVSGVASGSANVSLRDSLGVSVPITVTVSSAASLPLTVSPANIAGVVGETLAIVMFGGDPPYSVTSSNGLVAALTSQNANRFALTLLKAGATPVIVSDARGQSQTVSVTSVSAAVLPMTLSVPASVTIPLGASRTVSVSGGVTPYVVGSSNEAVLSASVTGSVLTLTPVASGTASVAVTDAAGTSISLSATVGSAVDLFTTAPGELTLGQGTSQTFSVLGGRSPYFASSGNPNSVSASVTGSVLTITGGAPGSGSIAVRDSVGASVTVAVVVGNQTPLFTSAPANVVMSAGSQRAFLVDGGSPSFAGGVPAYQVISSDPAVATANLTGNSLSVTAVSGGTTQVVVTDSLGARIAFQVTVGGAIALHTTAPASVTVSPGALNAQTYEIRGGASPYTVTSGNVAVATVAVSGNLFTVTGAGVGAANVQVTDRLGANVSVAVTVASGAAAPLSVSPLAATGTVGDVIRFEIRGGTPVYTATVANQNVAAAATFGASTAFTVQLTAIGSSNIAVIDSLGQVQNVTVTAQNVNLTPLFTAAPSLVSLAIGSPQTFTVGGGSGTYLFASSDPVVVTVPAVSSTQLVLTPVGVGTATISVTDSAGVRTSFNVVVGGVQPLRLTAGAAVTLGLSGGAKTYGIIGGRTPYTVVSTNAGVVSASPPGLTSDLILSPVAAGTANVVVTDAAGTQVSLAVTVAQSGVQTMTVSPASASANVGDNLVFAVTGGTSPYTFTVNNSSVATLTSTSPGPSPGQFRMDNAGSTTITVTDATGQLQTVNLTVTQATTQLRLSPTTLMLPETYQLGVSAATTNLLLNIYGGSGGFTAYTTDPLRTAVSVVNGSQIRVSNGTSGTLCSNTDVTRYAIANVAVNSATQPAASNAFDIVITVVDNKGASATAKLVILDDGLNLNPNTTCR